MSDRRSSRMGPVAQRKARRAFTGLVGRPPEQTSSNPVVDSSGAVVLATQTVAAVLDAVSHVTNTYGPERDQKVREAMAGVLSSEPAVKRGPGRPRKYSGETVQERERNRKRIERTNANSKLARMLAYFDLKLDSEIPPGLQSKYGIEVKTYRELIDSSRVETKIIKQITADLKLIGAVKVQSKGLDSDGKFMTDAPRGKGRLVYSEKPDQVYGVREGREHGLSKPVDGDNNIAIPESLLSDTVELPLGDRRKATPVGAGPDE